MARFEFINVSDCPWQLKLVISSRTVYFEEQPASKLLTLCTTHVHHHTPLPACCTCRTRLPCSKPVPLASRPGLELNQWLQRQWHSGAHWSDV
jgi:hypothetical protein